MTTLAELEARLREAERLVLRRERAWATSLNSRSGPMWDHDERCAALIDARMARNEALLALLEARMREQGREVRRGGE